MDEIVVDSSVVIKWFVVEPHSTEARRLLDEYQNGAIELLAPDLLHAEVGNIAWKKHRFQGMAAPDAQLIVDGFRGLKFTLTSTADLLDDAFRLAVAHQRTVYDMMYVALGLRNNCRIATADEKLVNALSGIVPKLTWIANWP
jgi:predicted nucleic acid-binding protein